MSNDLTINLQDSGLFSALAYAPIADLNSIQWGLNSQTNSAAFEAAELLNSNGWVDETVSLLGQFAATSKLTFHDAQNDNEFRVFVNTITGQAVFAFKGSNNLNNFISDLSPTDQGATAYQSIEAGAVALFQAMNASGQFSQIFADGHSLGGGMAQTFALQVGISGFGENSLPIPEGSQDNTAYWLSSPSIPGGGFAAYL
jgi:hypothetical protein